MNAKPIAPADGTLGASTGARWATRLPIGPAYLALVPMSLDGMSRH